MQQTSFIISTMSDAVLHCLYPAAIILCLVRPGLGQPPRLGTGAGFQVLQSSADGFPPGDARSYR